MAIVRTGKDRRPRGPNGSRVGRDTRSYTAISELGTGENGERLRKWKSFPTQREAKAWVAQTIGEVNKGTYVEPTKQTVREFAREWIEAIRPSLKQSTASSYESVIRLYILPAMGGVRLASVTPEMVGKLYSSVQAQGLSSRTARYAGQILKTLLGSAVREGKLPRSPAEYVKPPDTSPSVNWGPGTDRS